MVEENFASLLAAINNYSMPANSPGDGLIVATNGTDTAYYIYSETGAGGNDFIDFSEVSLLGVVEDAVLTTNDFQVVEPSQANP